jgi:nucleoid-associated protein YgaU
VKEVKDWGLAPAQPRGSVAGKIAGCLAVAAIAAGGYFGYLKFAPPTAVLPGAGDQPASESLAGTESTPPKAESDERLEDPFGDSLDESFDELMSEPQVRPAKGTPRLAHHTPDAIPIQAVGESKKKKADRLSETSPAPDEGYDDEALLDLPLDLDEPATEATEPATESEIANDSEPPLLRAPGARREDVALPSRAEVPEKKAGRAASAIEEDALGGFDFAEEPAASVQEPARKFSGIAPVDAQESNADFEESDPLEGFELEETNRRQASSRTVVMRSPPGAPSTAAENDGWIVDDSPPSANRPSGRSAQNPSSPSQRITPRHPAAPAHTPSARVASELHPVREARPHTESYTVVPNDNFWAISRKQYGSGRYFAALAKHNHARIPDPQKLRAGMQVSTPPASVLEELYPELIDKSGAGSNATTPITPESVGGRPSFEKPTTARKPALGESAAATAPAGYFYSKSGAPMYRIGADDTLSSIAQRHLGKASRWTEIYEQNPEVLKNPENLTLGTVIRLPPDAAQIGLAPEVERRR